MQVWLRPNGRLHPSTLGPTTEGEIRRTDRIRKVGRPDAKRSLLAGVAVGVLAVSFALKHHRELEELEGGQGREQLDPFAST